jgi:hypothetical protein
MRKCSRLKVANPPEENPHLKFIAILAGNLTGATSHAVCTVEVKSQLSHYDSALLERFIRLPEQYTLSL